MVELVSPYINTELYAKVPLYPHQMNNEKYINLKINLRKKVEKKCNKHGYVTKIYKILNHTNGIIDTENFTASAIYNVKYSARLCLPVENTEFICRIDTLSKVLIKASNGPILCIIKQTDINESEFNHNSNGNIVSIKEKKQLKLGDLIKIRVIAKKFNSNDMRICVLGFLNGVPTNTEIKKYYNEDLDSISDNTEKVDNLFSKSTEEDSIE
jgi:DNA-directed RNA polymerase subunit E'/Rpb7